MKPGHASLAEQLAAVAPRVREVRARIRPVSQVSVRLGQPLANDRFDRTVDAVVKWVRNRAGRKLPDEARQRRSFELSEVGAQRLAAVAMDEPRVWALRLDDADKTVPLRTWITEVGIGAAPEGDVLFAVRLVSATRGEDVPYERTIPGFVRGILESGPAYLDGREIGRNPWIIDTEDAAIDLVDFLESPARRAPVVVFALPERSVEIADVAAPIAEFAARTLGCAHACVLTGPASFHLTDRLGRELSVFKRGVRTYLPGFKRWKDSPYRHPLVLPDRIERWPDGAAGFLRFLVDQTLAQSTAGPDGEEELPSFTAIRQAAARSNQERAKRENRDSDELLALALGENERLEAEIREMREKDEGLADDLRSQLDEVERIAQDVKAQNFALRERIRSLERRAAQGVGASGPASVPATLDDFAAWCRENLSGAVEVHNRALQGAKKSVFKDPALIYKALLLLRDHYVPMRLSGDPEDKAAYDAALLGLHLEDSATGDGWKDHREQYTVMYEGRAHLLERHLKQGTSRDPARAFRLYFFWDDDSQVVVVGWLPSHLDNALT